MKRAAVPLFRSVVPAITQIPTSLSDVAFAAKSNAFHGQGQQGGWEDGDHKVISTGISYDNDNDNDNNNNNNNDNSFSTTTTTTTTTTTSSLPTLWDSAETSPILLSDSKEIADRLEGMYGSLEIGYATNPATAALFQVVKDTTSDPVVLSSILKLDSFKRFTNTLPSVKPEPPRLTVSHDEFLSTTTHSSSGTQTDELAFLEDMDTNLQAIASQIIPTDTLASPTTTSSVSSTTPSSTVNSSTSIPTAASTAASSDYAQERSDFTEGSAGVPGNTNEISMAIKVIIPLAILAVAAVVALPMEGALNLVKSGFKFITRVLGSQPAF